MPAVIRFPLERASWPKSQRARDERIVGILLDTVALPPELVEEIMEDSKEFLCPLSSEKDPAPDPG